MAVEIVMPRLGWTMEVGTLVEWTKKHGEQIEAGEIVMLVESDKAVNEVEVFDTGILHIPPHSPAVGSAVPVGTPMAYILEPGEEPPAPTCSDLVAPNPAAAVPELATPSTTPQVAVQRQPSPAQPAAGKRSRRRDRQSAPGPVALRWSSELTGMRCGEAGARGASSKAMCGAAARKHPPEDSPHSRPASPSRQMPHSSSISMRNSRRRAM